MKNLVLLLVALVLFGFYGCSAGSGSSEPVQLENIREYLRQLSDDRMEGRGPGSRGGDRAAQYIAEQMKLAGLEPAAGEGSFLQNVEMVGRTPDPGMELEIKGSGKKTIQFRYKDQVVAWPGGEQELVRLDAVPVVFVGYGISAPERNWDDYKGQDVTGKVLLAFVNDPPSEDPNFFGGKALTYFGRWTYKFEEAARRGAAGVILVHNTVMAGYPWEVVASSWTGEQFALPAAAGEPLELESWVTQDLAEEIFQGFGLTFDKAVELAGKPDFVPVDTGLTFSANLKSSVRRITSPNVVGRISGNDPVLKEESVVVTSHYDHLGVGDAVDGDTIYNGALDNASGVALLLEVARAMSKGAGSLDRSIVFVAVTGEEQGLLGSAFFVQNPVVPLPKIIANVNFDAINVWGETDDIVAMGSERSTLRATVERVAAEAGLTVTADQFPEHGGFFRSDQFSFVKAGIPAVYYLTGSRFKGKEESWSNQLKEEYLKYHYHQPSDEYEASWPMTGSVQMGEVIRRTISDLCNAEGRPQWNEGDPFAAASK